MAIFSQQTPPAEILEYFNKLSIDEHYFTNYDCDINENYSINQNNINEFDDNYFKILDYFQLFCNLHLNNIEYDVLVEKKFFKSVHFPIYSIINKMLLRDSSDWENNLIKILDCIEITLNYFITKKFLKFEHLDYFFLSTLKSLLNLILSTLNEKKIYDDVINKVNFTSRIISIVSQVVNLFEANKFDDLNESHNHKNLMVLSKQLLVLTHHLNNARAEILVWKVLSRLVIKQKLFLTNKEQDIEKNNCMERFYLLIFECLSDNLKMIRNCFNAIAKSKNENFSITASSLLLNTQLKLTNCIIQDTLKAIKFTGFYFQVYKSFISTYFKNLINFNEKNNNFFFSSITAILSLINYILLVDFQIDIDTFFQLSESSINKPNKNLEKLKEFQQVKLEFIKEIVLKGVEILYKLLDSNINYFSYITMLNLENKLNEISDEDFLNDETKQISFPIDELLLFFLVYLNRCDSTNNEWIKFLFEHDLIFKFSTNLFFIIEMCFFSSRLPIYLIFHEPFFKSYDFNTFKNFDYIQSKSNSNNVIVEFYDFIFLNACKLIQNLFQSINKNVLDHSKFSFLFYYLINSILLENKDSDNMKKLCNNLNNKNDLYQVFNMRVQLSFDVLYYISVQFFNSKTEENDINFINYLKFLCDLYEDMNNQYDYKFTYLYTSYDFSQLIIDIFNNYTQNNCDKLKLWILQLEEYFIIEKQYLCYSLFSNYIAAVDENNSNNSVSLIRIFKLNSFKKIIELYSELILTINSFNNKNSNTNGNDQIWINKILHIIETNSFEKLITICINLIEKNFNDIISNISFAEILIELSKKIIDLLKLNKFKILFCYFQSAIELNTNVNSHHFEIYQKMYSFFTRTTRLLSLLSSLKGIVDNSDVQYYLIFLSKTIKLNFDINHSSQEIKFDEKSMIFKTKSKKIIQNFKIQSIFFLKSLSFNEIKDQETITNMVELFVLLLNDENPFIKYFTLQSINEYLVSNQSNKKIFPVIRKKCDSNIKCLLDHFVQRIEMKKDNLCVSNQENETILKEQNQKLILFFKKVITKKFDKKEENFEMNNNSPSNSKENVHSVLNLNDTLNLIMSAMDTTVSNDALNDINDENKDSISYSPKYTNSQNSHFEKALENVRNSIEEFIKIYIKESRPIDEKKKFKDLLIKYDNI